MSRFYEALKQASRSLNVQQEITGAGNPDIAPILNEPEVSETAEIADLSPLSAGEAFSASSEPAISVQAVAPSAPLGVATDAVLDKRARLIPNAEEPVILEHYRLLRTKIMQARAEKMFQSLLVASAIPGEGKTLTTLNLAFAFAMLPSFKVLVVDGDIRRGNLSRSFSVESLRGLSNLLDGSARLNETVRKSAHIPFWYVTCGNSRLPAPELLALETSRWPALVRKMREHFDLIVVDSPPVSLVADAQLLAAGCEAVLLVARAFHSSCEALQKVSQEFRTSRVIGTVLNGSLTEGSYRRYRNYYPYTRPSSKQK